MLLKGRLSMQRRNQQAALQITRHLTGADQQPHHQRPVAAGIGPRRPFEIEPSRNVQR